MEFRAKDLETQLRELAGENYPFHMPGHKRRLAPAPDLPYAWDTTEVEGADDLHHADGILLSAMQRTALLCHSEKTWYLVGGSTCGNLAGVRAIAKYGQEIIAARNCHKSIYHAAELLNLDVHWVLPKEDPAFGIQGSTAPEDIGEALRKYPGSRGVVITSPTYEGVVSDIREIAGICHRHGVPLMVDEAHGAHLGLFPQAGFPDSAVHLGADLVVQSAHKTLPSLTQTALLHRNGNLISDSEIERELDVFETSSPSYPLMVSLDACTRLLSEHGEELFSEWSRRLADFDRSVQDLQHLRVLCYGTDRLEHHPGIFAFDQSKILVHAGDTTWTGEDLADLLREEAHIETEMHCGKNVLCMTSCADTDESMIHLADALHAIDKEAEKKERREPLQSSRIPAVLPIGERALRIGEAADRPAESVPLESSLNRISAEYVFPYPPGIPILVPGERISREALDGIRFLEAGGSTMIHSDETDAHLVRVLRENDRAW